MLRQLWVRSYRVARTIILVALLVTSAGSAAWFATILPTRADAAAEAKPESPPGEVLRRLDRDTLAVSSAVAAKIGLQTVTVAAATKPRALPPFQGTLALDSNALARGHPRFAGEVVDLGTADDLPEPRVASHPAKPTTRPLRPGDKVTKNQLLAVVWSKDLGEKKSELVDAVSKLRLDEEVLHRLEDLYKTGSTPERSVREQVRAVEGDRIAVERAERTLRSWRLTEPEVAAVRAEADRVGTAGATKADPTAWARVEVRAPQSGVILEKNVATGDIVDTTTDLFKIGDLSELVVWAHAFEEDLPALAALPRPVQWTINVPAWPGETFGGTLDQVSAVIDPAQHTALLSGRVANAGGLLKVGQFVTVTVQVPAKPGELELPPGAVIEDGRESCVFVKTANRDEVVRTSVQVCRRCREAIYVKSGTGLTEGKQVVTAGSLLLRDALDELPLPKGP